MHKLKHLKLKHGLLTFYTVLPGMHQAYSTAAAQAGHETTDDYLRRFCSFRLRCIVTFT